ncbi:MAG TPA: hypothetical protein VG897_01965, partial [Terriglobales bacterium]|nr:hypothetical protein [Terriglobales bacterium]
MGTEFDDKDMNNALTAWRKSVDSKAEQPEWFWVRQRSRIESRMHERRPKRLPTLAWAGIAATLAVGAALMIPGDQTSQLPPPKPVEDAQVQPQISDHELLQQLQETMNSEVPDALQPASTLAQEM